MSCCQNPALIQTETICQISIVTSFRSTVGHADTGHHNLTLDWMVTNKQSANSLAGKLDWGKETVMPLKHLSVSEDEEWNREKGEKKICSGKRRKVDVSNLVNVLGDWKNTRTLGTCSIMYWFSLLSIGSHRLLMFDILHNRCTTL